MRGANRTSQIETMLREWLDEPALTLICGDWRNGCIMEILPEGPATLTRQKYAEPFTGLRDIEIPGQPHHLHVNLDKLARVVYTIMPCVCYGYRPSFEVRFDDEATHTTAFALGIRQPYLGRRTNRQAVSAYFRRMIEHHQRFPDVARFHIECRPEGWEEIVDCFMDARQFVAARSADTTFPISLSSLDSFEERPHA